MFLIYCHKNSYDSHNSKSICTDTFLTFASSISSKSSFNSSVKTIAGRKTDKGYCIWFVRQRRLSRNSDVDIMILVKMTDEEIRTVKNDIYDLAFEVEMNTGIEISPVIKNEEQYEYWVDTLPFYRNVRDEGVVVSE